MTLLAKRSRTAARTAHALDVLVILNPVAARTASAEAKQAVRAALRSPRRRSRIVETTPGAGAREAVAREVGRALKAGCRRVVAVGGDGTVAMTAAALLETPRLALRTTLGIIPTGTANVLARELGIPLALDAALTLALEGDHIIELDAILAGDRPVFTQVGVGLDAQMIRHTSRNDQIKKGRLAYVTAFLRRALNNRPESFELDIDGKTSRVLAWQIIVANVGVLGAPPFTWGPGIDPSDGALDVCVYSARTLKDYVTLVQRLLTGRHRRDAQTRYLRAQTRIVVRSRRPVLVQGDGEILGRTPITLDVAPRALRICVPKDVEQIEPMVGSPGDAKVPAAAANGATPAEPAETIREDVDTMVAQHSRTWLLQGWLRHPFTFLSALDAALYMRINALQFGPAADRALILLSRIMHYGEGWGLVTLAMLAVDFGAALHATAEALPVLWATMLTVNYPLKTLFRRRRPFIAFVRARVLGPKPKDFSFPSGHTAAAFAGAVLFGAHVPLALPLFLALATVVGFSRIYLGVHYPSDVVIGAILGVVLSGTFLALFRSLVPMW